MQRNVLILSIVIAVAVGITTSLMLKIIFKDDVHPPAISKLHDMGHLVTLKSSVSDIIQFTPAANPLPIPWVNWNLPTGTTTVVLIAKGDCLIATDLREAKYGLVDKLNRTIKIALPAPRLLEGSLKWDDGQSAIYAINNKGLNRFNSSKQNAAINGAIKLAQEKIQDTCKNPEAIRKAKDNTEIIINALYGGFEYKANIEWSSP